MRNGTKGLCQRHAVLLRFRSKVQPLHSHQKDLGSSSQKAVNTFSKTKLQEGRRVWCFPMKLWKFGVFSLLVLQSSSALGGYGLGSAPTLSQVNVSWIGSSMTGSCSRVLCGNKQMWRNTCLRALRVPGSYGGTFTLLVLQNATLQQHFKTVFKMWGEYNQYRSA